MKLALGIVVSTTLNDVIRFICLSFSVLQYWYNFFFLMVRTWSWKPLKYWLWETLFPWSMLAIRNFTLPFLPSKYHWSAFNEESFICVQTLGSPGNIFYSFPVFPTIIEWKGRWMSRFATSNTVHFFGCLSPMCTLYWCFYTTMATTIYYT